VVRLANSVTHQRLLLLNLRAWIYVCSVPSVKLADGKGLSDQQVEALRCELVQLTRKLIGEVKFHLFH